MDKIFSTIDLEGAGIITGENAVRLFSGVNLPDSTLGEIWSLADPNGDGWLTRAGVLIAIRLMGWAQCGREVRESLLEKRECQMKLDISAVLMLEIIAGPLPAIDGISLSDDPVTPTSSSSLRYVKATPETRFPPLTPENRAKFLRLFHSSDPVEGIIDGTVYV